MCCYVDGWIRGCQKTWANARCHREDCWQGGSHSLSQESPHHLVETIDSIYIYILFIYICILYIYLLLWTDLILTSCNAKPVHWRRRGWMHPQVLRVQQCHLRLCCLRFHSNVDLFAIASCHRSLEVMGLAFQASCLAASWQLVAESSSNT